MVKISKQLKDFIEYEVAPGYAKNLNKKGIGVYKKKLAKTIKRGGRIKI